MKPGSQMSPAMMSISPRCGGDCIQPAKGSERVVVHHARVTLAPCADQAFREVAADEATGAGDEDGLFLVLHVVWNMDGKILDTNQSGYGPHVVRITSR